MSTKPYNYTRFTHEINGVERTIKCWTTDTRNGFCHHAEIYYGGEVYKARISYLNRTYECFRFETCIERLIDKLPKADRAEYRKWFIDYEEAKAKGEADDFLKEFQEVHTSLSQESKDFFAEHTPMINSQEQAHAVLGAMKMAKLFETLNNC